MKMLPLAAAALLFTTSAIAQDAAAPAGGPAPAPGAMSPNSNMAPSSTAPESTAPEAAAPEANEPAQTPPDSAQPSASAPVPSEPSSMPPAGASSGASMGGQAMAAGGTTDTSSYPTCSRTVTDKCVQRAGRSRRR